MAQGKGPGYERWAKVYNLKQMAAALQYLREHDLMDYDALAASTEAAVDRAHKLARRALCSTATRRPGILKSTWPSTRRSWLTTGRPKLL